MREQRSFKIKNHHKMIGRETGRMTVSNSSPASLPQWCHTGQVKSSDRSPKDGAAAARRYPQRAELLTDYPFYFAFTLCDKRYPCFIVLLLIIALSSS